MRPFPGPLALVLAISSSVLLGGLLILAPALVHATDKAAPKKPNAATCTCPDSENAKPWPRPKFADAMPPGLPRHLDMTDEMAALEAVHLALSEVGDGASYVWHRRNGRISGIISPTASFKDAEGRVCRHITVTLTAGPQSARTEGIACRMTDKSWRLEG
jgi:hypothetical protein